MRIGTLNRTTDSMFINAFYFDKFFRVFLFHGIALFMNIMWNHITLWAVFVRRRWDGVLWAGEQQSMKREYIVAVSTQRTK